MAHAVRAWALDFQFDYSGAEESITRALELDSQNALAYAYQVEILVDSYYNGTGAVDAIEKAAEASKIALTIAPDLLEAHRARAYIHEAVGEYEDAIREYEAALAINGNIALLHLSLGINYRRLEFYDKAIEEFTNANTLNPDDPDPDLYLSRTYATIGKYAQAMQYAETAVGNSPAEANLRGNLGVMYYYNAFYDKAIVELGYAVNGGFTKDGNPVEAINLSPNIQRSAEYYYTYGRALSRTNKCGEALKISQLIFERVPADELAVENANAIISQCQQNLEQTPTPLLTSPEPATASPTGTMSAETPTPTPTP
jgi:tetratricopeptide (TPR) repeat protein